MCCTRALRVHSVASGGSHEAKDRGHCACHGSVGGARGQRAGSKPPDYKTVAGISGQIKSVGSDTLNSAMGPMGQRVRRTGMLTSSSWSRARDRRRRRRRSALEGVLLLPWTTVSPLLAERIGLELVDAHARSAMRIGYVVRTDGSNNLFLQGVLTATRLSPIL